MKNAVVKGLSISTDSTKPMIQKEKHGTHMLKAIRLLEPVFTGIMMSTAAQVVGSWAAPLHCFRGQCLSGGDPSFVASNTA